MIARHEPLGNASAAVVSDQYVVAFGKSGGLGCFTVIEPLDLFRGARVVLRTPRGQEIGEVLGPATLRQARLIGSQVSGDILRHATAEDDLFLQNLGSAAEALFEECRRAAHDLALPLQILDVEVLLDGENAIVQFVGGGDDDVTRLADALPRGQRQIRFENLAAPGGRDDDDHGRCDKPDCGRINGGGGCTSCGTGGGCSSCGAGHVDLRPYFAHLRDKMEASHRTPLV